MVSSVGTVQVSWSVPLFLGCFNLALVDSFWTLPSWSSSWLTEHSIKVLPENYFSPSRPSLLLFFKKTKTKLSKLWYQCLRDFNLYPAQDDGWQRWFLSLGNPVPSRAGDAHSSVLKGSVLRHELTYSCFLPQPRHWVHSRPREWTRLLWSHLPIKGETLTDTVASVQPGLIILWWPSSITMAKSTRRTQHGLPC